MSESGRVQITEDVVFGTGGDRELRCDVYTPPGNPTNAPAVLLLHGGGWARGDRKQLQGYGILIGREGYVCIASEYRLTGESSWPAQIHDVKAAIRWMRASAGELGIDPRRIAVEGNSAGAHLALLAAGTPNVADLEGDGGNPGAGTEVAVAIGVYAPTVFFHGEDRTKGATPVGALMGNAGTPSDAAKASPLSYVGPSFPPTMLIHGTHDETVSPMASIRMYEELFRAGVPAELHMYAEQPHAFDARREFGRQCAAEMLLFLGRYLTVSTEVSV